ncbi:MAG: bifunctional phosphoribosylaminoimidazolecarboxamide formyltransferase/IMP cyclohydrolase [Coriobacteriia bacterium]|nr:bifunctional phosphoribosylaminoimidazolecarboxamide formyltransferase/IMP cyclohydrolase [Coriobacteriia bacterium]MCL2537758.1 bifunctional phosphoribosylaminoimidazolecarboxamide formyltransferase/IMP cyclohydrolase [Coriobacteriia bacterium]
MNPIIKRALVSVTDKTGIVDFCRSLIEEFGIEVVSTGGTAAVLAEAGLAVTAIEEVTGFPEMMDGRVKTLHPKVHGGLLARRSNEAHMKAAAEHGITAIDLVVVNLYAFEATLAAGATEEQAIENIDIGGPSMLRSAAKNFESVCVVTDPAAYDSVLAEMRAYAGATALETRKALATEVFALTARYDAAIAEYLTGRKPGEQLTIELEKVQDLRYGENPHQEAAFYRYPDCTENTLAAAEKLQGKELSYNNILDTDAAWSAVRELPGVSCVIVKHTNPCGAATADDVVSAYQRAWEGDPISAFGGIIAINRPVTAALVQAIYDNKQFVEVFIAPSFEADALELLATKPNMRVLATGGVNPPGDCSKCSDVDASTLLCKGRYSLRSVEGGVLAQIEDVATEDPAGFTVAGKLQPTESQLKDLVFAWKVCKSVKSNAITLAKDQMLVGMGAGQPNRVNSARVAIAQAEIVCPDTGAAGCVAASDAFIPFPDTVEVLAAAGVKAIIHPGGSIRDEEVVKVADDLGVILVATGRRHFRH